MYGLPQVGILAQKSLNKRLNAKGYRQSNICPGFWKHDWRPIFFSLCVDNFGIKYVDRQHAQHLIYALKEDYTIPQDWAGTQYIGLTIDWDYEKQEVNISMTGYIEDALTRFKHARPRTPKDQPHPHVPPNYGATRQYAEQQDNPPLLDKAGQEFVQEVCGTVLYYARAVEFTILAALGLIAMQQASPTENTMCKIKQLLDYNATYPYADVTYWSINMVLADHSNASYLSDTKERSRAGGNFFMARDISIPGNNGTIHTVAQIIKTVMSSTAEVEINALYINCRKAIPSQKSTQGNGTSSTPNPYANRPIHRVGRRQ